MNSLKRIAEKFDLKKTGSREEILKRFLTSFISLREFLEAMRNAELSVISRKLKISPLPANRGDAVDRIYNFVSEKFYSKDSLQVLNSKYSIIRPLGEGGQGKTFLGKEKLTDRLVVIKQAHSMEGESFLSRELKILASLDHPNIARLYTYEIANDSQMSLYVISEYCDGLPLYKAVFENETQLANQDRKSIVKQSLEGLAYFHQKNVIHGDISLGNIILMKEADNFRVKFIDFGASKLSKENTTHSITNSGYSAPEIPEYLPTTMSDVYSLSVVISETLTSEALFPDRGYQSNIRFIEWWMSEYIKDQDMCKLLMNGLQFEQGKRIQNGMELKEKWFSILGES